jgi:hypothetical protein
MLHATIDKETPHSYIEERRGSKIRGCAGLCQLDLFIEIRMSINKWRKDRDFGAATFFFR